MIKVRVAQLEDIPEVIANAKDYYNSEKDLKLRLEAVIGRSFIAKDRLGRIGLMFGYHQVWGGVLEVWAVTTKSFDYHKVSYVRFMRHKLKETMDLPNIHRLQIYVKARYPHLQRWAESLGFEYEGRHPNMGSDLEDYYSYGRVK